MKKYIIVDSWNGEGYSDSDAKIVKLEDDKKAIKYCFESALEQTENSDNYRLDTREKYVSYTLLYGDEEEGEFEDEDHGTYLFEEYTGQYAVIINPMINECRIVETRKDFEEELEVFKKNAQDQEQLDLLNKENFNCCFDCLEEGDVIISILDTNFDLENYEICGGDGVTNELWEHKKTKQLVEIPIEIVRDFDNIIYKN